METKTTPHFPVSYLANTPDLTDRQRAIVDLLWNHMKKAPGFKDRVLTDAGSKTKIGLARTVEALFAEGK